MCAPLLFNFSMPCMKMFTFGTNYTNIFHFITFNGSSLHSPFSLSHTNRLYFCIYHFPGPVLQLKLVWLGKQSSRVESNQFIVTYIACIVCRKKSIKINVFIVSLSPNLMQWKYWLNKLKCTYNKLYEIGIEMPEHRELASVGEIDRSKWCTLPVATCKLTFTVFYQATE